MLNNEEEKYKLKRLREFEQEASKHIDNPLTKKRKLSILIIVCLLLIIAAIGGYYIYQRNEKQQAESDFNTAVTNAHDIVNQLLSIYSQNDTPSTTTMTQSEWDNHYDDVISQLGVLMAGTLNISFKSSYIKSVNIDNLNMYVQSEVNDINSYKNYIVLSKSNTDLSFQIVAEKQKLSSDYNYDKALVTLGGNADLANSTLDTERTQLNDDISISNAQSIQVTQLLKNMTDDFSNTGRINHSISNPQF